MVEKPIVWLGTSLRDLREFPEDARRQAGYLARFAEAVYVLHALEKRTQATRQADLTLAKQRLASLLESRKKRKER